METEGSRNNPCFNGSSDSVCPLLAVLGANEHGLVMESRCGFEVGATVSLGFHLHLLDGNASNSPADVSHSAFVSAETLVVESSCQLSESGELVHRVTMLFSEISRKDRDLLMRYSEQSISRQHVEDSFSPVEAEDVSSSGDSDSLWLN